MMHLLKPINHNSSLIPYEWLSTKERNRFLNEVIQTPCFNWPLTFTTRNLTKPDAQHHPNRIHDLHSGCQNHHPPKNSNMKTLSKINTDKYFNPTTNPSPPNSNHIKCHNPCRTMNRTYTQHLTPNNLLP